MVVSLAFAPISSAQPPQAAPEAISACTQFARALDLAALSYSDFANALALGQVNPNYGDPTVAMSNTSGRAGLREAAELALAASRTPGLARDVATPMRAWSVRAVKLLVLMGLRADVDRFNAAATTLNEHTEIAQMACARAGSRA
ncbi:hypothetical protein [Mycolicibacterium poriferae]|uniref:hypothetical protein n=1 Tax=Mycolicibacterium poriferae TaxID=39694 RepID=UPI0024BB7521|nr:hypothetical protein [Mycolicibacterium poriferae]